MGARESRCVAGGRNEVLMTRNGVVETKKKISEKKNSQVRPEQAENGGIGSKRVPGARKQALRGRKRVLGGRNAS